MKRVNPTIVFQVSIFLSGVLYILLPILKTYELLVMFSVLFGLIDGLFLTSLNIVNLNIFKCPKKTSSGFGIMMTCVSVALGAGPPVAGKFRFYDYFKVMVCMSIFYLILRHPQFFYVRFAILATLRLGEYRLLTTIGLGGLRTTHHSKKQCFPRIFYLKQS